MLALRFYFFIGIFLCFDTWLPGQNIELYNSSWEDFPHAGLNFGPGIRGWKDCGFTGETPPDIHSGEGLNSFFDVVHQAHDGTTYLGMVTRENDTWEAVSQRLSSPIVANKCYSFSLSLSKTNVYNSTVHGTAGVKSFTSPIVLRIHGGSRDCQRDELLAESEPIDNQNWETFEFKFEPKSSHRFIIFEAFYKTPVLFPYNGNLLLDNASTITVIACDEEVYAVAYQNILAEEIKDDAPAKSSKQAKKNNQNLPPSQLQHYESTNKTTDEENIDIASRPLETPLVNIPELNDHVEINQIIALNKLHFKADSSNFHISSIPALTDLYEYLRKNNHVIIEIRGHTNNLPPRIYCDKLSKDRARSVRNYLRDMGIPAYQLQYRGCGKREPIASNDTAEGRRLNQRVEIKIISMK